MSAVEDRTAFAQRLRLQLQARYRGHTVSVEAARFAIRITGSGVDTTLSLAPLYDAAQREPQRTSSLIADFVRAAEGRLDAPPGTGFSPQRVLWCVRSREYLEEMSRAGELLRREVSGDIVAFVAETLPGSIMRGIPRGDWETRGYDDAAVAAIADRNTAERFAGIAERVLGGDRVPNDGWQYAGDPLFAGSALLVPSVLRAFADRAGGDVLIGVPDRSLLMAIPAASPGAERFQRRVTQAFRNAMTPCSRDVLLTDGTNLRAQPREEKRRRGLTLMGWLQD
ncbi:MAG TPA: hypothetical protein VGQ42_00320 [Candidatus Dormibacteraeota bacterium]|jgi:hypothetical protein|nr:hypothetical protein [Candidatus Dormibacteraeota bacterium]